VQFWNKYKNKRNRKKDSNFKKLHKRRFLFCIKTYKENSIISLCTQNKKEYLVYFFIHAKRRYVSLYVQFWNKYKYKINKRK